MSTVLTIAGVTLREAGRRRLLLAGVLLGIAFVCLYTLGLSFIISSAPCELLVQTPAGRDVIRDMGTVVSLLIPTDALWRLAAYQMTPSIARDLAITPFTPMFPPSGAIAVWGLGYVIVTLAVALRAFERRTL